MKLRQFIPFVTPSALLMVCLLAFPLMMTIWLSARTCTPALELVTVKQVGPFGAMDIVTQRARLDSSGSVVESCNFVGLEYYKKLLGLENGLSVDTASTTQPKSLNQPTYNEFSEALKFTLLYVAATTPTMLLGGLVLALAVNRLTGHWRGFVISASLLPFIITPVVGALTVKWLFRDHGLISHLLAKFGLEIFWMSQAWSARLLIILYGVWQSIPFAFIVLFAGIQSAPKDSLEASMLDGATSWQRFRFVLLPHLAPLMGFVTLIHLMDAYRIFEPVFVLTQGAFTSSVQYLTYYILLEENNPFKASAAAVLTLIGISVLLLPLLRRTWREQRGKV